MARTKRVRIKAYRECMPATAESSPQIMGRCCHRARTRDHICSAIRCLAGSMGKRDTDKTSPTNVCVLHHPSDVCSLQP